MSFSQVIKLHLAPRRTARDLLATAKAAPLGPHARAGTTVEAAAEGDIVVVTIPLKSIASVPVEPLVGKVVIDTNNYYPERDGQIPELDDESTTTSELLQALSGPLTRSPGTGNASISAASWRTCGIFSDVAWIKELACETCDPPRWPCSSP